jgi:hypothetical protein
MRKMNSGAISIKNRLNRVVCHIDPRWAAAISGSRRGVKRFCHRIGDCISLQIEALPRLRPATLTLLLFGMEEQKSQLPVEESKSVNCCRTWQIANSLDSSGALPRTPFLKRELLLLCCRTNLFIDLVLQRLYVLTCATQIRVAI